MNITSFQKRSYERFGICGAAFAIFCCSCLKWEPLASIAALLVERSSMRKVMNKNIRYDRRMSLCTLRSGYMNWIQQLVPVGRSVAVKVSINLPVCVCVFRYHPELGATLNTSRDCILCEALMRELRACFALLQDSWSYRHMSSPHGQWLRKLHVRLLFCCCLNISRAVLLLSYIEWN